MGMGTFKMNREEVEKKLISLITPMFPKLDFPVTPDTQLVDMGFDSFGLVELFVGIEKNFKLQLMESGILKEDLASIKSLASFIDKKLQLT